MVDEDGSHTVLLFKLFLIIDEADEQPDNMGRDDIMSSHDGETDLNILDISSNQILFLPITTIMKQIDPSTEISYEFEVKSCR